ncbi:hypothetical protein N7451_012900 [Penicillium sp. IBT 35674x]|nr:hypothetical protein N7451_012900 [Penicillium sp. IBT 35674x]
MIFDTATGNLQNILKGHSHQRSTVAFSSDSRQLVSGAADCTVRLWDTTTGDLQKTLVGHTELVQSVAFSPDGKQVVSGSTDGVNLWDAETGELHKKLSTDSAWGVAFSPDSMQIAAGFEDGTTNIWDAAGNLQKTLRRHAGTVGFMSFSPDGKELVTCSNDSTIKRWDNTISSIQEAVGHSRVVTTVALSLDGKMIASGSVDNTIKLWDAVTGDLQKTLAGHLNPVKIVVFTLHSRQIASCSSDIVNIWDAATGVLQNSLQTDDAFRTVALSPDSKHIATGHINGRIRLWDMATSNLQKTMAGYTSRFDTLMTKEVFGNQLQKQMFDTQVTKLKFSPDGKLILSAAADRVIRLWDAGTGDLLKRLPCYFENFTKVIFSPETGYPWWISSVAFSLDSQYIAAACGDKIIRVWSIERSLKATKFLGRAVGSHIRDLRAWKEFTCPVKVYHIEFAADNPFLLQTDCGPVVLKRPPIEEAEELPVRSDSDSLQNLSPRTQWLCYGGVPFLRLMPDFAAISWDTHGDRVVLGFDSGQVSSFKIDRRSLHSYLEQPEL